MKRLLFSEQTWIFNPFYRGQLVVNNVQSKCFRNVLEVVLVLQQQQKLKFVNYLYLAGVDGIHYIEELQLVSQLG